MEHKRAREAAFDANSTQTVGETTISDAKADYLARKQSAAEARREKAQRERLAKEAAALEKEIEEIDAELFGEAASDYTRAAALDARKTAAEERLLEIYELIGV